MNNSYPEKQLLSDALNTQKYSTGNFNLFSNECAHETVRSTVMRILNDEHEIQNEVFHMMSAKGFYPTPAAEQQKIMETKQKFQNCCKCGQTL